MKIIKRYANRRLYDPESSKTITLEEIAQFIKNHEEFKVIDNANNEDITNKILAQTFLKINLSGVDETLNSYLLSTLIRESSESIQNLLQKMVFSGIGLANQTKEYIENIISKIIHDLSPKEEIKENAEENKPEKSIIKDLSQYVYAQANELANRVQNGIKSLGIDWLHNPYNLSHSIEEELNKNNLLWEEKYNLLQKENDELRDKIQKLENSIPRQTAPTETPITTNNP